MSLRRFWIDLEGSLSLQANKVLTIKGDLAHHLKDVCRIEVGQEVELLCGDGLARRVLIESLSKREVACRWLSDRELPILPTPHLHLFVSIPKLPKLDLILEKSVELGVHTVSPFVSDYSFLRKKNEISDNRKERWNKIVQGATQQCGRGDLMSVGQIQSLDEILKDFNQASAIRGLFPFEGEAQKTLKEELRSIKVQENQAVWLFVGSEGGFSHREVELFQSVGLFPLTLGDQVLRVETACLALVSILKYELNL